MGPSRNILEPVIAELVNELYYDYEDTKYYQEIIKECGYVCHANY